MGSNVSAPSPMHITAIFATMNRSATAVGCIRALAAQSRPPDRVIVADNQSTDTTVTDLQTLTNLPFPLEILELSINLGNAGGCAAAIERAFDQQTDAVWILDDDSWPRPPALEALIKEPWDHQSVRHAHQLDPASGKLTWPLQVADQNKKWSMITHFDDLPDQPFTQTRILWTGTLIPRKIYTTVGPVLAELFIRGEDEEYPLRIERAGFSFFACRDAIMDHPGPTQLVEWKCLGKRLFYEKELADWKLYYKIRNMIWIKKNYEGHPKAIAMAAAYTLAAISIDGPRRIPLLARAIHDGIKGKLGKWKNHPITTP